MKKKIKKISKKNSENFTSLAVEMGEVASLTDKAGDDAVKKGPLVPVALLARAQCPEVFSRLGNNV